MSTKGKNEDWERWNTHFSTIVEVELFGVQLRLMQDPNSQHLGTTVWDSSIVLAKYFEKNARKGEFGRQKVKGKRAIELGAGMGLGGLAFAMMGCDVVLTDVAEVIPLLQRNFENNLSRSALQGRQGEEVVEVGSVSVAELDWENPAHYEAVGGPFDFVLAADCVYRERLVEDLLRTVLAVTTHKSTVLVANELRSDSVHSRFMEVFSKEFTLKKILHSKMDAKHQHHLIDIYVMKRRKQKPISEAATVTETNPESNRCSSPAAFPCHDTGLLGHDDDLEAEKSTSCLVGGDFSSQEVCPPSDEGGDGAGGEGLGLCRGEGAPEVLVQEVTKELHKMGVGTIEHR